jgi:HK97 family phage prohead protease
MAHSGLSECAIFVAYRMSKITKTFTVERKGDWVVASTPAIDRDKDRVIPRGIDTANFQGNPALFFGHIYDQPWSLIGRVAEWKIEDDKMTFRPELREPVNEADPMTIIKSLWESGLLRAASIGFIPRKGTKNEAGGTDFTDVELLEISLVGLPANQTALRLAMKGMGMNDETEIKEDMPADEAPAEPPADEPKPADDMAAVMDELRAIVGELRELLKPADAPEDMPEDAPADEPMQESAKGVTKRGRVLSAGNESKLRTAYDSIGEVLAQIGDAPDEGKAADDEAALLLKELAANLGDLPKFFKK